MTPGRYESPSAGPRRLPGRTESRGAQTGFGTGGAFAFGGAFVAAGCALMLVGTGVIAVDLRGGNAPRWVLTAFGAVLAICGAWVWTLATQQLASNRRRAQALAHFAGEPALADYGWDPQGCPAQDGRRALKAVAGAGLVTLFLSIFNWWAFFTDSNWVVKAATSLFDLALLAMWAHAAVLVGRALKFGGSRIAFARFPYRMTDPVDIRWRPASGIGEVRRGAFTLRCVKEWYETRGSGSNRSSRLVHEEQWSGTWLLDHRHVFAAGTPVGLRYRPPAGLPPTSLSADQPVFWEFEVTLDLPGFDFRETYLVPLYAAR